MRKEMTPNVRLAGQLRERGDLVGARALLIGEAQAGTTASVLSDLGAICLELGDLETAGAALGEALKRDRPPAQAFVNAGLLAGARGDPAGAETRLREAVARDGKHVPARLHLAGLLTERGRLDEASTQLALALRQAPAEPIGLSLLGRVRFLQGRMGEAFKAYAEADRAGADVRLGLSLLARARAAACDWRERDTVRRALRGAIEAAPFRARDGLVDLTAVLALEDDPVLHRAAAETTAASVRARVGAAPSRPVPAARADGRLRVGYLGDAGRLAEAHDGGRFAVSVYRVGAGDEARAVAERIAADGVEVLVDLARFAEVAALRPAPVQLLWPGLACTSGADWFDGVLADPVVLPAAGADWSERVFHLPCWWRAVGGVPPAADRNRAGHGLPAEGVVLACFGPTVAVTPERFGTWMEVLREVPGSVLWLAAEGEAAANLRAAAGVLAERVVFAPAVGREAGLARFGCVDLALDTGPLGSAEAVADGLSMGVPAVTAAGRSFASRTGASLLTAAGLGALIAEDEAGYRALAVELAGDASRRRALGERAAGSSLFDREGAVRALERVLEEAWASRAG